MSNALLTCQLCGEKGATSFSANNNDENLQILLKAANFKSHQIESVIQASKDNCCPKSILACSTCTFHLTQSLQFLQQVQKFQQKPKENETPNIITRVIQNTKTTEENVISEETEFGNVDSPPTIDDTIDNTIFKDDKKIIICSICHCPVTRASYSYHRAQHKSEKHTCHKCGKDFSIKRNLTYHLATVHYKTVKVRRKDQSFVCDICGLVFKYQKSLSVHQKTHSDERNFKCTVCDRTFKEKEALQKHTKTHQPVSGGFRCNICEISFQRNSNLKRHKLRCHSNDNSSVLKCEKCDKTFFSDFELKSHLNSHDSKKTFSCTKCTKSFKQFQSLQRHLSATHSGKAYSCEICSKKFNYKSNFNTHLRFHEKTKQKGKETSVIVTETSSITTSKESKIEESPVVAPTAALTVDSQVSCVLKNPQQPNLIPKSVIVSQSLPSTVQHNLCRVIVSPMQWMNDVNLTNTVLTSTAVNETSVLCSNITDNMNLPKNKTTDSESLNLQRTDDSLNICDSELLNLTRTESLNLAETESLNLINNQSLMSKTDSFNIRDPEPLNLTETEPLNFVNSGSFSVLRTHVLCLAEPTSLTESVNLSGTQTLNFESNQSVSISQSQSLNLSAANSLNTNTLPSLSNCDVLNSINATEVICNTPEITSELKRPFGISHQVIMYSRKQVNDNSAVIKRNSTISYNNSSTHELGSEFGYSGNQTQIQQELPEDSYETNLIQYSEIPPTETLNTNLLQDDLQYGFSNMNPLLQQSYSEKDYSEAERYPDYMYVPVDNNSYADINYQQQQSEMVSSYSDTTDYSSMQPLPNLCLNDTREVMLNDTNLNDVSNFFEDFSEKQVVVNESVPGERICNFDFGYFQ